MTGNSYSQNKEMHEIVPASLNGWESDGDGVYYDSSNLYDYIDGGAEVYLAFNFRKLFACQYEKPGQPAIIVDLFDMGSPMDAYGVYFNDLREGDDAGIGQNSEWMDGSLFFHKGGYFVSIISFDETEEAWKTVRDLGKYLDDKIEAEEFTPGLIQFIPPDLNIISQIQYFHVWQSLNTYYYLASENILNLDKDTEGILAKFRIDDSSEKSQDKATLIIIKYPSQEKTVKSSDEFKSVFLPDADETGISALESSLYAGAKRFDNHIIILLDVNNSTDIEKIFQDIRSMFENK